jgi:hypothetical protein
MALGDEKHRQYNQEALKQEPVAPCMCLHKGQTGCKNPAVAGRLMCEYCIESDHVAQCPTCKGHGVLEAAAALSRDR